MRRRKNQAGVIDPISIFTVLFLVVTLVVGTAVTTNRGLSLNISEKAAVTSDATGYVVPLPNVPVTCVKNCSGKTCGSDGCGGTCGSCTSPAVCSGNQCTTSPSSVPTTPVVPTTTTPGYDLNTAINSANNVPGSPGYDCRKGGCGPGSGPVSGYYEYNGKFYPIGGTGNNPATYNEPKYSPSEIKIAKSDCDVQGGTFVSDIGLCYKADSFTTKEKTDEGFITHITTIYRNLDNGALIDANTIDTIATTTTRTSRDEDINGHGLNTQTTYLTTRDAYTGAVLNNYVTSQYVAPGPIAGTYVPKYSSKAECQQNTDKNAPAYHGQNEYNSCGQYATSTETWTSVFNTLDTITFGTFSNYAESYAPDKVVLSWKEAGYPTLKACQQDMIEKYHNPHAPASCNTYTPTKEQLSSSIQLGTVLTAEAALLTTGVGYGSGALTGAQALTNGLAISTVYQTGTAASTCIDKPGSPECKEATVYAALSWANVGTAANLANATGDAIQTARYINTAVNALNVAADVHDTINACSGENANGVGCAISSVATLLDVGGGALDIAEIAKDINISGLGNDIGGWPVDVVPTGTTTITDSIPTGNTIGDLTEAVIPASTYTDLTNIDNAIADISPSQLVDLPGAESIPEFSNTFADDIAANLPQNIDSSIGDLNTNLAGDVASSQITMAGVESNNNIFESPSGWFEENISNPIQNLFQESPTLTYEEALSSLDNVPPSERIDLAENIKNDVQTIQADASDFRVKHYTETYGPLPAEVKIPKELDDYYSFQQKLIQAAKNNEIDQPFIVKTMKELEATGNVKFVVQSPEEIFKACGGIGYCQTVVDQATGFKKPTVFIASPNEFAQVYDIPISQATNDIAALVGHEAGHAYDDAIFGIYGINPNSPEGLWASELLQQQFSTAFEQAAGIENLERIAFVDHVKTNTNIQLGSASETQIVATSEPQGIFDRIKNWLSGGSNEGNVAKTDVLNLETSTPVEEVIKRVDNALTSAGEPNGIGCRKTLCEASAGYIKIDAEINGFNAENINLTQINLERGVPHESTLLGNNTHEITILSKDGGKRYLVDLTLGQFNSIDFSTPIAKKILEDGFVELTEDNLNAYLKLFTIGDSPNMPIASLDNIKPHPIKLGTEEIHQYLSGQGIDLNAPVSNFSTSGMIDDMVNASEILTQKGYSYEQIDEMFAKEPLRALEIADTAPDLNTTNWFERNIVNPISSLFTSPGTTTTDIKNIPAPSKLTTEEAEQVINLVPDAVKAKYAQAIKETGSLSSVQFDENRFWSMDVKPKDTRLSPDAVEELMDRLTVGTLNAQGNMIISPKGDHMVFIDVDPNRESSIAKVVKFLEEKAPQIIQDVYVKYGIDIDPNTIKVGDYVGYGVGLDSAGPFKLNVLDSGHVVQQATLSSGVITGSSLALATENIPDALRGDDFLPILIQGDSGHPNLVSMTLEDKGFTLEGYVLPKSEVGQIVESLPNIELRTDQSLIQAALPTAFETYFSPEAWKDVLTPEQFSQIGKSPVTAAIPDAGVTSVALDVVNVEVPNAFVGGLDASPISKIVGEIRLQNGEGSATEAGLRTILANWFTDQTKIMNKYNLAIGEFAGDGFKVVGKEKLSPKALAEFVNMTTSLDRNVANAAKGLYGPDAKAAAAFLNTNFPDEIYVKVILDQTNARFKFLPGDGYTPVILKTDSDLSKLEKLIKNYKAQFGNSDKIATVSPAMLANYTEADLKKAGMKIIETDQGIFLVKRGNPIVEWFNANIWSTKGILFPSLVGAK